jgi:hypothetical protein
MWDEYEFIPDNANWQLLQHARWPDQLIARSQLGTNQHDRAWNKFTGRLIPSLVELPNFFTGTKLCDVTPEAKEISCSDT